MDDDWWQILHGEDDRGVHGLDVAFYKCTAPIDREFDSWCLAELSKLGMSFFEPGPFPSRVELNLESRLDEERSFISIDCSHPIVDDVARDSSDQSLLEQLRMRYGRETIEYSFALGSGHLRCADPSFSDSIERMGRGKRGFLKIAINALQPQLAFIDETWGEMVKAKHLNETDLRKLFWVTYFGPRFVEKHGSDFLMETPAWQTEKLGGGVLVTVTESFVEFAENEPKATLKYLKQKFKNIRANRFKIDPNF